MRPTENDGGIGFPPGGKILPLPLLPSDLSGEPLTDMSEPVCILCDPGPINIARSAMVVFLVNVLGSGMRMV